MDEFDAIVGGIAMEPLTPLEKYGVEAIVDYAMDSLPADAGEQVEDQLESNLGRLVAKDPLLRKLLGAWMLEHTVAQGGLADGIVGRAVDGAIEQLTPYAKQNHLWWSKVMET